MATGGRYGLRNRQHVGSRPEASAVDAPTVEALLSVGLKPRVLSKPERRKFGALMAAYIPIRCVGGVGAVLC
jgi:hypothetical protein